MLPVLALGVATIMAPAGAARAGEFNFNPYVAGQYLQESNVYKFSQQIADVTGTSDTSDNSQRYTAGVDTGYIWSQQKLTALVEGRQYRFDNFQHLDHNESTFAAAFDGGIMSHTRTLVDYREERRMASFEGRRNTQLVIERDRVGRAGLNIAVQPDLHLLAGVRRRNLDSPLPSAPAVPSPSPGVKGAPARNASPDFALHETAYNAGVEIGIEDKEHPEAEAPLVYGLMLESQNVNFSGVTPQPAPAANEQPENFDGYRLLTLLATTKYALSTLSRLKGQLGITQYSPAQGPSSDPDLTGEIGYTRGVSPITELNVQLYRRIVAFAATTDASTDTGASIGAKWEPIRDLTVLANYGRGRSEFKDAGRSDDVENASLSFAYPQFRYFHIRVFGTYSDRRSNLSYNNFTDETVGAELSFRWRSRSQI